MFNISKKIAPMPKDAFWQLTPLTVAQAEASLEKYNNKEVSIADKISRKRNDIGLENSIGFIQDPDDPNHAYLLIYAHGNKNFNYGIPLYTAESIKAGKKQEGGGVFAFGGSSFMRLGHLIAMEKKSGKWEVDYCQAPILYAKKESNDPRWNSSIFHEYKMIRELQLYIFALFKFNEKKLRAEAIIPYIHGEELFNIIADNVQLSSENKILVCKTLVFALIKIWLKKYIHRDLKLENILITAEGACLIDFQALKPYGTQNEDFFQGTAEYFPPAMIEKSSAVQTLASEIWTLGYILKTILFDIADDENKTYITTYPNRDPQVIQYQVHEFFPEGGDEDLRKLFEFAHKLMNCYAETNEEIREENAETIVKNLVEYDLLNLFGENPWLEEKAQISCSNVLNSEKENLQETKIGLSGSELGITSDIDFSNLQTLSSDSQDDVRYTNSPNNSTKKRSRTGGLEVLIPKRQRSLLENEDSKRKLGKNTNIDFSDISPLSPYPDDLEEISAAKYTYTLSNDIDKFGNNTVELPSDIESNQETEVYTPDKTVNSSNLLTLTPLKNTNLAGNKATSLKLVPNELNKSPKIGN